MQQTQYKAKAQLITQNADFTVEGTDSFVLEAIERYIHTGNRWEVHPITTPMELPAGYYAHIVPRSSTCKNWGIIMANSMGVIENNYAGDDDVWGFPAYAIRSTKIPAGTRIAQFRLVKCAESIEFQVVDRLGNVNRGGWGSTGTS